MNPSPWDNAPRSRIRFRTKSRDRLDHEAVLGPEPTVRQEAVDNSGDDMDQAAEEDFPPVSARYSTPKPKRAEVDEHLITHLPFRPWCSECIQGRGVARPHRRSNPATITSHDLERVIFDWSFFRDAEGASAECANWN